MQGDDDDDLDFGPELEEDDDDFDFGDEEDDEEGEPAPALVEHPAPTDVLDLDEDDDEEEAGATKLPTEYMGLPKLGKLEAFDRESLSSEEVTTPAGLLFEIKQFLGGKPIAYDPCSCPWAPTRATHANMLKQYRPAQLKLSTDALQQGRYKHNFPGKVTFGDGLSRPFPAEGLTYVFPGFKASKTQQWLKKARTESIQHRVEPDGPRIIQNGNELAFAGEVIVLVSLEHIGRTWFDYVWAADAVCFLRQPLWFGGEDARSKQGSALVYYGYRRGRFRRAFAGAGRILRRCDIKYTGPRKLALYESAAETEERLGKEQQVSKAKAKKAQK